MRRTQIFGFYLGRWTKKKITKLHNIFFNIFLKFKNKFNMKVQKRVKNTFERLDPQIKT